MDKRVVYSIFAWTPSSVVHVYEYSAMNARFKLGVNR